MLKYRFIFLLLVSAIYFSSYAQETGYLEGYIVTLKGDTITGLVKNKNFAPYRVLVDIKFKSNEKGKVETYSPKELIGFKIGPAHYVSKDVDIGLLPKKLFLEVVVEGYLTYYALEYTGFGAGSGTGNRSSSEYVILQKKNDPTQEVYDKYSVAINFKKRMAEYLKDSPELVSKINDGTYTRKHVDVVVKEYNKFKTSL